MYKSNVKIGSAQQKMTYSLSAIQRICDDEQRSWWFVLISLKQFEQLHRDYRTTINTYREYCCDTHWSAMVLFSAMSQNEQIVDSYVKRIRRNLHLTISHSAPEYLTTDYLLADTGSFTSFAKKNLNIEFQLLSEMLETLFDSTYAGSVITNPID